MATNQHPIIDNEIIELVETMRQAQVKYFEMARDRSGKYQEHQKRRALQAMQTAEHKVDVFLANYKAESVIYQRLMDSVRTDEIPGLYNAAKVSSK